MTGARFGKLGRRQQVAGFVLKRAQEPLWGLAYGSLASFGKIA